MAEFLLILGLIILLDGYLLNPVLHRIAYPLTQKFLPHLPLSWYLVLGAWCLVLGAWYSYRN